MDSKQDTKIEIDSKSGFCFGVINAIHQAENALEEKGSLYCLGDIVHNGAEVSRLTKKGLVRPEGRRRDHPHRRTEGDQVW